MIELSLRLGGSSKVQVRPFQKNAPLPVMSSSWEKERSPTVTQLVMLPQDTSFSSHPPGGPSLQMSLLGWARHDLPRQIETSLPCVVMQSLLLAHDTSLRNMDLFVIERQDRPFHMSPDAGFRPAMQKKGPMHDTLISSPPGGFIRCQVPLLRSSASACRLPALMYAPTAMHQLRRGQETALKKALGGVVAGC